MLKGFLLCIQFFTIIPYKKEINWEKRTIEGSLLSLPLLGVLIGSLALLQYWFFQTYTPFSMVFVSLWLLFYFIAFTGGLHIDGWMDCSDAYFSYRDVEKRLQIMDDPRVGSFAVLSVIFLLGFRLLFMFEILFQSNMLAAIGLLIIPVLTRLNVVLMLVKGRLSKQTGLAAAFQKEVGARVFVWTFIFLILLTTTIPFFILHPVIAIILVLSSVMFLISFYFFCVRQFGGINGDTLGALLEGGETFLWFVLWLLLYYVMV